MPGEKAYGVHPRKDQFDFPDEANRIDHKREEGAQGKMMDPKASGFKEVSYGMGKGFKEKDSVNPMGSKQGNPSGFPGL